MSSAAVLSCLALAVALVAGAAVAAFTSTNAVKRFAAVLIALAGAALALAVLKAPALAVLAAIAVAFSYIAAGLAITVRLQESYGAIESDELDAADAQDEPRSLGS